jgi:hypothetical protein
VGDGESRTVRLEKLVRQASSSSSARLTGQPGYSSLVSGHLSLAAFSFWERIQIVRSSQQPRKGVGITPKKGAFFLEVELRDRGALVQVGIRRLCERASEGSTWETLDIRWRPEQVKFVSDNWECCCIIEGRKIVRCSSHIYHPGLEALGKCRPLPRTNA